MTIPRFVMLGGFLGAGKTTTIAALARHYQSLGRKVGIVTNDQAPDLVDTFNLQAQGFDVDEVPGSCFCCNFDGLTAAIERLGINERPDVVLAEPVGSCTDLVATVLRPLARIYQQPFEIAPYGVILKPSHGEKILNRRPQGGFSPEAAYIFRKQIEEADFVILNRIDELSDQQIATLVRLVHEQYPDRPVLKLSAKNGLGVIQLADYLQANRSDSRGSLEVDYDIYAAGEADLGWLNSAVTLGGVSSVSLDTLVWELIAAAQSRLAQAGAEIAHFKILGHGEDAQGRRVTAVVNVVASGLAAELSVASRAEVSVAACVINARVAIDPALLETIVRETVFEVAARRGLAIEFGETRSFRPGRPVPTHRIVQTV